MYFGYFSADVSEATAKWRYSNLYIIIIIVVVVIIIM